MASKGIYAKQGGVWRNIKTLYVNVGGAWFKAYEGWNSATGGTVTDVDDYNGTGQKWRVHTFTDSGTFTVSNGSKPFRVLWLGGPGSGGYAAGGACWSGGGGAGGYVENDAVSIEPGSHSITVGKRGSGATQNYGTASTNTVAFGVTAYAGGNGASSWKGGTDGASGGGGNGSSSAVNYNDLRYGRAIHGDQGSDGGPSNMQGAGGGGVTARGTASTQPNQIGYGGAGKKSDISGASVEYGRGGNARQSDGWAQNGNPSTNYSGIVIIAYQIG